MKSLGGFFELELGAGEHFHKNAIPLNSGRSCLRYLLEMKKPAKVYLPAFSCNSLIAPLEEAKVPFDFYHINSVFEIQSLPKLQQDEKILYINYFALKREYVKTLYGEFGSALIVDNTQAFFENPMDGVDTFYSPRKFFGVSDGGYLYTELRMSRDIAADSSMGRFQHLIGRLEDSPETFYEQYLKSENSLSGQPVKKMSRLTSRILRSLDYEGIAVKRQRNFWALNSGLPHRNRIRLQPPLDFVPMIYPFFSQNDALRSKLIASKIYTAQYWAEARARLAGVELFFLQNLIPLPIDQRITQEDLDRILDAVLK